MRPRDMSIIFWQVIIETLVRLDYVKGKMRDLNTSCPKLTEKYINGTLINTFSCNLLNWGRVSKTDSRYFLLNTSMLQESTKNRNSRPQRNRDKSFFLCKTHFRDTENKATRSRRNFGTTRDKNNLKAGNTARTKIATISVLWP